jgi:hypothetical protein
MRLSKIPGSLGRASFVRLRPLCRLPSLLSEQNLALLRVRLELGLAHATVVECIFAARLAARDELRVTTVERVNAEPREVVLEAALERGQQVLVRRVRPAVVVDYELPRDRVIGRLVREVRPSARRARVELARVSCAK